MWNEKFQRHDRDYISWEAKNSWEKKAPLSVRPVHQSQCFSTGLWHLILQSMSSLSWPMKTAGLTIPSHPDLDDRKTRFFYLMSQNDKSLCLMRPSERANMASNWNPVSLNSTVVELKAFVILYSMPMWYALTYIGLSDYILWINFPLL